MNFRTATITGIPKELRIRDAGRASLLAPSIGDAAERAGWRGRVDKVVAIAAAHAAEVDRESRFPKEAIAAARAERLFGVLVPREFGGDGLTVADVTDICYALGRACASTAMIYAMHQTKVACIVRHGRGSSWHQLLLRRLCAEQLLLASSTTEGQAGGDLRNSAAPVDGETRITLERQATVISYGEAADGIVTTARRSADAASSDQVLVIFLKENYSLERLNGWDAFGMRGTCSAGFKLVASGLREQILPVSYEKIHAHTMMPCAHLVWSSAWAGIAAAAVERARAFVRKAMHRSGGELPPGAAHLTRAGASLRTLRSLIASATRRFEAAAAADPVMLESIDFQTSMNMLKVNASELAVAAVMSAMQTCGLSGYRNDSEFSIGRHLRDILSSPIMISNDRILANVATASVLGATPESLRD